jgi:hypothetical protein
LALVLVVLAVVVGMVVSSIVPSAGESGVAWIPAMIAFPGVPLSILVAVLRYRLYEIDTLINRAVVYGLLTAILAGGSAAAIAVMQRVFSGVIGPGSDLTIILTTLVVVSTFDPIKKRVQALVDRRFKEVHSPAATLEAFLADLRGSFGRPEADRTLRLLVAAVAQAYRAAGVEARVVEGSAPERVLRSGKPSGEQGMVATSSSGDLRVTLSVFRADPSLEATALERALAAVLLEISPAAG